MKHKVILCVITFMAIIISTIICCTSCSHRWPIARTLPNKIIIKQIIENDYSLISIYIPDAGINSAVWPLAKLDELGNDTIIIKIVKGGVLGEQSEKYDVKVKREKDKVYHLIIRDENDKLNYIRTFKIE